MSENKLLQENSSRCNKILLLQQQLKETTENLQQSWKKLDSLGEQYEDTFQQQNKIMVGLFASPSSIAGSLRVMNRPRGSIWKFQIKNNNMHNWNVCVRKHFRILHQAKGPFLESPETFLAHFGWHNSRCIFIAKASGSTKLCSCFNFYSLYNIWKDQLYRISGSQFYEWLFGTFSETGPRPQIKWCWGWAFALFFRSHRRAFDSLSWLNTVSSTYIRMGRYNHSLSLDATIMVSKNCSVIGENVVIIFLTL